MFSFTAIKSKSTPPRVISNHFQTQKTPLLGRVSKGIYPIQEAGIGSLGLDKSCLINAIQKGFRLIDTAKVYKNEKIIGEAIAESGIDPNDVFVSTKLFNSNLESREALSNAVEDSIAQLGKIPEIFLMHGPYPEAAMLALFNELESMKKTGLVKEYGVSNFDLDQLQFLVQHGVNPVLNQVEYHPYFQRPELLRFCQENNIVLQAYRPLAEGKALSDHTINSIAQEHRVKPACIVYTWLSQLGIPIVAKVSSNSHQNEYAESGQIELSAQQMHAISSLNQREVGRTCKKGGWLVPFTSAVQKQWMSDGLRELKKYADVLNIEGGLIPKHCFTNPNQKWANVGVVLDHPFMTGIDLEELSKMNKEFKLKEALIPEYNERKVCLAHATILKYYIGQAHKIANKIESENVNVVIQVHRGSSSLRQIEQLEHALSICFGNEFQKHICSTLPHAVSAYASKEKNLSVEFRYGYRPETIGHYERADIVVSLSMVAGLKEELPSGSLVLPCQFIPMSLKDMIMKKQDSYKVTNHLADNLSEMLSVQTEELVTAVNQDPLFTSENKSKQHIAKKLSISDFSSVTLLEVDGLFNPKKLSKHFSIDFGRSPKAKL